MAKEISAGQLATILQLALYMASDRRKNLPALSNALREVADEIHKLVKENTQ